MESIRQTVYLYEWRNLDEKKKTAAAENAGSARRSGASGRCADRHHFQLLEHRLVGALCAAGVSCAERKLASHVVAQIAVGNQVERQEKIERSIRQLDLAVVAHEDVPLGDVRRILLVQTPAFHT